MYLRTQLGDLRQVDWTLGSQLIPMPRVEAQASRCSAPDASRFGSEEPAASAPGSPEKGLSLSAAPRPLARPLLWLSFLPGLSPVPQPIKLREAAGTAPQSPRVQVEGASSWACGSLPSSGAGVGGLNQGGHRRAGALPAATQGRSGTRHRQPPAPPTRRSTCSPLSSSTGSLRRNRRGSSTAAPVLTLLAVPQPLPPVPAVFHLPSLHLLGKLV